MPDRETAGPTSSAVEGSDDGWLFQVGGDNRPVRLRGECEQDRRAAVADSGMGSCRVARVPGETQRERIQLRVNERRLVSERSESWWFADGSIRMLVPNRRRVVDRLV
jgi:hypothetical protein